MTHTTKISIFVRISEHLDGVSFCHSAGSCLLWLGGDQYVSGGSACVREVITLFLSELKTTLQPYTTMPGFS